MSRLEKIATEARAQNRKMLIPYLVAGDPDIETSLRLMHELVSQGADIIEVGIPFSDPASDGPVIQRGVERALASGTSLAAVLEMVGQFRQQDTNTGIVLMGYLNPIEIMGYRRFAELASNKGVDGVLVVDLPPAESGSLASELESRELDRIFLIAPTTSETRTHQIVGATSGYLYYVSLKGVTGAAIDDPESIRENIDRIRSFADIPIVVGFGIKDGDSARAMAALSDGVVVGSALVSRIGELRNSTDLSDQVLEDCCSVIGNIRQSLNELAPAN